MLRDIVLECGGIMVLGDAKGKTATGGAAPAPASVVVALGSPGTTGC